MSPPSSSLSPPLSLLSITSLPSSPPLSLPLSSFVSTCDSSLSSSNGGFPHQNCLSYHTPVSWQRTVNGKRKISCKLDNFSWVVKYKEIMYHTPSNNQTTRVTELILEGKRSLLTFNGRRIAAQTANSNTKTGSSGGRSFRHNWL